MKTTKTALISVFLNTWANYNENGADGGFWVNLPCDLEEVLDRLAKSTGEEVDEMEVFINDYETDINGLEIGEHTDLETLNETAEELESLDDYNCNHRETPIICGVSEPAYSQQELARLKAENEKQYEINGISKDGYGWSQVLRRYEAETRNAKDQINALQAFGNSEPQIADLNNKIKAYRQKYNEICDVTGIKPDLKRMSVPRKPKT